MSKPLVQSGLWCLGLVHTLGSDLRAGLLAPGSTYSLRLPIPLQRNSGLVQGSSPVTAAGPRRLSRLPH